MEVSRSHVKLIAECSSCLGGPRGGTLDCQYVSPEGPRAMCLSSIARGPPLVSAHGSAVWSGSCARGRSGRRGSKPQLGGGGLLWQVRREPHICFGSHVRFVREGGVK
jgi:hypothetical protein